MSFRTLSPPASSKRNFSERWLSKTMIFYWRNGTINWYIFRTQDAHSYINTFARSCVACVQCVENFRIWRWQRNRYGKWSSPFWWWGRRRWRMYWSEFGKEQRMDNGKSVKYLLNLFFMRGRTFVYICPVETTFIWFTHRLIMPLIDTYIHLYQWHIEYAKRRQ